MIHLKQQSSCEGVNQLIKCRVTLTTADGAQTYDGLFPTTCDAVIDALTRIGLRPAKVSVKAMP